MLIWCIRIIQNLDFLQLAFQNFFIAFFLSSFSAPLLSLPFKFHILSRCRYNLATWQLERERVQTNCKLYEEKPILSSDILRRLPTRREDIILRGLGWELP